MSYEGTLSTELLVPPAEGVVEVAAGLAVRTVFEEVAIAPPLSPEDGVKTDTSYFVQTQTWGNTDRDRAEETDTDEVLEKDVLIIGFKGVSYVTRTRQNDPHSL